MTLTTFSVASAVTPTVIKTCVSHYTNRKPRGKKPTAHISYDEGLHLIKTFLTYASHKTVDELQAFTAQWVPTPTWVKTDNVNIPAEYVSRAADALIQQLGPDGIKAVGGQDWWQWRRNDSILQAEWIEMSSHYTERKRDNKKSRRIMLYVHGGGYFFGSVDEHRYQMQRHARKLKARVIAPRYRLSPQFPFPCGLLDCLAVYLYLLTQQEPNEIIFAGDSAGGGMVVSMLCLLRDRGLPLPAGAVLISPWVDLTHSFPSVSQNNPLDYIPPHGFHHRPSIAWPPPGDNEIAALETANKTKKHEEAFMAKTTELAAELGVTASDENDPSSKVANRVPAPGHFLSIELDDKLVVIKEQIQMYTTNQLLSHPLVSPILQPSLGGLPPLLFMVGGGEMLRDEQIYLAHKAASPHKYPLSDIYRTKYDPEDKLLNRYKATPVQLQVWQDLCHVAPTLSFTRPAKYMYRSIAQFGAWALARAQERPIEIMDDDNISIISTESDSESPSESTDSIAKMKHAQSPQPEFIGRAGDPLPFFHNHMIRQLVDRYGNISHLPSADELPATTMDINEVGLIKPGPVKKWMQAKESWASKYSSTKRRVQKQRVEAIQMKKNVPFGDKERPPPSALAARRTATEVQKKQRKSYGLAMWSMWGSKHDEATIKREDEMGRNEQDVPEPEPNHAQLDGNAPNTTPIIQEPTSPRPRRPSRRSLSRGSRPRQLSSAQNNSARSQSRRRTISVTDRGQASAKAFADYDHPTLPSLPSSTSQLDGTVLVTPPTFANATLHDQSLALQPPTHSLTASTADVPPLFLPKFRTSTHLHSPSNSRDIDTMSTRTGYSAISTSGASTRAVFSAPGVSKVATDAYMAGPSANRTTSPVANPNIVHPTTLSTERDYHQSTAVPTMNGAAPTSDTTDASHPNATPSTDLLSPSINDTSADTTSDTLTIPGTGTSTPISRNSLDRLRTHNLEYEMEVRAEAAELALRANQREAEGFGRGTDGDEGLLGGELGSMGESLRVGQSLRNPSTVAVVGVEGVVGVVGGNNENRELGGKETGV